MNSKWVYEKQQDLRRLKRELAKTEIASDQYWQINSAIEKITKELSENHPFCNKCMNLGDAFRPCKRCGRGY